MFGAIGGPITLFKGLDQIRELTVEADNYTSKTLAFIAGLKLVAVVIASTRLPPRPHLPSVFAAVALGLVAHAATPQFPEAVAIPAPSACSSRSPEAARSRSSWDGIVGDPASVRSPRHGPLPAWLVVTGRPEMTVEPANGGQMRNRRQALVRPVT